MFSVSVRFPTLDFVTYLVVSVYGSVKESMQLLFEVFFFVAIWTNLSVCCLRKRENNIK